MPLASASVRVDEAAKLGGEWRMDGAARVIGCIESPNGTLQATRRRRHAAARAMVAAALGEEEFDRLPAEGRGRALTEDEANWSRYRGRGGPSRPPKPNFREIQASSKT